MGGGGLIGGLGGDISVSAPAVSSERVYVYRHNTGRGKSEGPWRGRAEHNYDAKRHVMKVCMYVVRGIIPSSNCLCIFGQNYRNFLLPHWQLYLYRTGRRNSIGANFPILLINTYRLIGRAGVFVSSCTLLSSGALGIITQLRTDGSCTR